MMNCLSWPNNRKSEIEMDPCTLVIPRLYAIIDPAQAGGRSAVEDGGGAFSAGVRLIQLRDKHASSARTL